MTGLEETIMKVMQKVAKRSQMMQILSGVAREVGESTMNVERDGAPILLDVRLNAIDDSLGSWVTIHPAEGSNVIVGVVEGMKTEAVLIRASEVRKVSIKLGEQSLEMSEEGMVINGGQNGGMVTIGQLTGKLNELVQGVNSLVSSYNSHTHVTSTLIGNVPTPGMAAMVTSQVPTVKQLNARDYENEKVKQ